MLRVCHGGFSKPAKLSMLNVRQARSLKNPTYGVCGTTYKWIESYLDGQSQFVTVGDCTSAPVLCEFSIPHGSVLGPLLFTIYTSPISNVIAQFKHVNHTQYPDDTQLYIALNTAWRRRSYQRLLSVRTLLARRKWTLSESRQDWSSRDRHRHKTQVRRKNPHC